MPNKPKILPFEEFLEAHNVRYRKKLFHRFATTVNKIRWKYSRAILTEINYSSECNTLVVDRLQ